MAVMPFQAVKLLRDNGQERSVFHVKSESEEMEMNCCKGPESVANMHIAFFFCGLLKDWLWNFCS